jgi:hypothetical protein
MRLPTSRLIGISSPYRKAGLLYARHRSYFGKDSDDVMVVQAASHVMNPLLDTADRDRMMVEDRAAALAEWYAEFRGDLVSLVDPAVVDRAVIPGRAELPPVNGVQYVAGTDPSGGSSDSMTLAISHADGERVALDLAAEWKAPFSPEAVVAEIATICRRYGISTVIGDRYGGEWPRERFRVHGIEYAVAPMTRSDYYLTLLPALNSGRVDLIDNQRLISQLCGLERRTGSSGRDSVDHARGAHDDVINAAAIALCAAAKPLDPAILVHYQRQVDALNQSQPPPTLQQEHAGQPIMQNWQRRPSDGFVKLVVPVPSSHLHVGGVQYLTEAENGQTICWVSTRDALDVLGGLDATGIRFREANAPLLAKLQERAAAEGYTPSRALPGIRVQDLLQAADETLALYGRAPR